VGALAGIVCGLVAAAPAVILLSRESNNFGHGIASVAFSFLLVQVALVVVRLRWHDELLPFGTLASLTFLLVVIVAVARRELR